ncbi:hypothetical protein [Undibacterium sp. TS12]|uniref:hypothetical protein n=1 Tax=Undibacterium sp. TS12 TaxID=2908202 RepID=UPI001F4D272E|nr:hypothetical protein [Undibacterium sp. TS12]MCH8617913.1 hypothetical protein [Undibacterium sp. TS12]
MSNKQIQWLMKALQPEKTLGSLPGIATLTEGILAMLIDIDPELYWSALKVIHMDSADVRGCPGNQGNFWGESEFVIVRFLATLSDQDLRKTALAALQLLS